MSIASDAAGYVSIVVIDVDSLYLCAVAGVNGWLPHAGEGESAVVGIVGFDVAVDHAQ